MFSGQGKRALNSGFVDTAAGSTRLPARPPAADKPLVIATARDDGSRVLPPTLTAGDSSRRPGSVAVDHLYSTSMTCTTPPRVGGLAGPDKTSRMPARNHTSSLVVRLFWSESFRSPGPRSDGGGGRPVICMRRMRSMIERIPPPQLWTNGKASPRQSDGRV